MRQPMNDNRHSYYVRFAREYADAPWRIVVETLADDDTRYFATVSDLQQFFCHKHCKQEGGDKTDVICPICSQQH